MAHEVVKLQARTPKLLTNSDATTVTLFVKGPGAVVVKATEGASAPSTFADGVTFKAGQGEQAFEIAEMFSGVSGANRLHGFATIDTEIVVSYV